MAILNKGTDFGPTEQVTSGKLDNLVDAATFVSGGSGTCETGGGLNISSNGRLQIQDGEVDLVKFSTTLKDSIHPVGIILETTQESTAAAFQTKIGFGTWEAYGSGQVTVGYNSGDNDFDAIGSGTNTNSTTGAKTHTLTESEMPSHTHGSGLVSIDSNGGRATFTNNRLENDAERETFQGNTNSTGGGSAHNNLQPYTVVYRYRRTA